MSHLKKAYAQFSYVLSLAEQYLADGDLQAAARLSQFAARYACPGHVGLFGSLRLEHILLSIGQKINADSSRDLELYDKNKRNILHVLTYARPIGGDTRFVWHWMQEDSISRHSVVITSQNDINGIDIPDILKKSIVNSGGFCKVLSAPTSQPLEQARELRKLCQKMDIVVLHLFPYDIIPILALAADCNSIKTLYINHSDHTFWIGASVAHKVVHLRKQSSDFLKKQRRLRPDESPVLPIPLGYSPANVSQAQAKKILGLEPDAIVLLTIASPFKYKSFGEIAFLDLVLPLIVQFPQVVLIAVGPEYTGAWKKASISTKGRVIPLGTQWDNDLLYSAADIYLDSIPFSSITSLLEAGIHGIPLLGYRIANPELDLLGAGAPGLDNTMIIGNDSKSYKNMLARLISDEDFRQLSGHCVQNKILSLHTGKCWLETVQRLYIETEKYCTRGCLLDHDNEFEANSLNLKLVELYSQMRHKGYIVELIEKYIGTLPYQTRLKITWHFYLEGFNLCFLMLLPPALERNIRFVRALIKETVRRFIKAIYYHFDSFKNASRIKRPYNTL